MHRCKRVNHALPGTWHLEDLEHFLCTSTAITTVSTSSNSPVDTESTIIVGGTVAERNKSTITQIVNLAAQLTVYS